MRLTSILLAAVCAAFAVCPRVSRADSELQPAMLHFPDVSATQIVFIYNNDVWIAPKAGGTAVPLSSPPGQEQFPRFSPDGSKVAYSAGYDGGSDIYELPVSGGLPKRLTYEPYGAQMVDYAPDGRVVFATSAVAPGSENKLYYADPNAGLPERLPIKYGNFASFSADGKWVAFTPWRNVWQDDSWNRYQGGQDADVWSFDLATKQSRQLTDWPGNDDLPMVHGDKVYYLSDMGPEHRRNIWVCDRDGRNKKQLTNFSDYETRWPAMGPDDIIMENGGRLFLLPFDSLKLSEIHVNVSGDLPHLRPQTLDVSAMMGGLSISPQAKRVAVELRGDVWTVPAKEGFARNLTPSDSYNESDPAWSPDGKWIAYTSDQSGEYEIYVRPQDGSGEARQVTKDSNRRIFNLLWSADSKKIAYLDQTSSYYVVLVESGEKIRVDTDPYGSIGSWGGNGLSFGWAPDSNWLAYQITDEKTSNAVICLYDLENRKSHRITDPHFDCMSPAFDLSRDYLFFTSNQSFTPVYSDIDADDFTFAGSTVLCYLPLRNDVKSPFAPRNDEEEPKAEEAPADKPADGDKPADADKKPGDEKKDEGKKADADKLLDKASATPAEKPAEGEKKDEAKAEEKKPENMKVDLEGIVARARTLPLPAGNYYGLSAGDKKVFYVRYPNAGSEAPPTLAVYDLNTVMNPDIPAPPETVLLPGVGGYQLTADASKMLVFANGGVFITVAGPGAALDKPVVIAGLTKDVDPRNEWRQMINEVWRTFKGKFYDPNMQRVNWDAVHTRALKLVEYATCREDVASIVSYMSGELNVGHAYVFAMPSDFSQGRGYGLLGCDFERATDKDGNAGIRISRIYRGADWELSMNGPLSQQGVDAKVGDFLLAVNGKALGATQSPYELLRGMAGKPTKLTLSEKAVKDDKARDVLVTPSGWDGELRLRDWIEGNRKAAFDKSNGRVGYIYVRDTGWGGLVDLQRQLIGQHNMDALIIDERYNGGGSIAHRYIEMLNRPNHLYVATQYGKPTRVPNRTALGAKVMIINQYAGSGGDCFPYLFRQAGLGPIVGVRTWGGLVGFGGIEPLLDGTFFVVPSVALYTSDRQWLVEGYGTDPDIEVVNDPTSAAEGKDLQLEKAIEVAIAEADAHPWKDTPRPDYVDRSGVRTTEPDPN